MKKLLVLFALALGPTLGAPLTYVVDYSLTNRVAGYDIGAITEKFTLNSPMVFGQTTAFEPVLGNANPSPGQLIYCNSQLVCLGAIVTPMSTYANLVLLLENLTTLKTVDVSFTVPKTSPSNDIFGFTYGTYQDGDFVGFTGGYPSPDDAFIGGASNFGVFSGPVINVPKSSTVPELTCPVFLYQS